MLDNIEKILGLGDIDLTERNGNVMGEMKMNILNEPIINTIIGAFIGIM